MFSDVQWEAIAELLPSRTGRLGRPFADARSIVEGVPQMFGSGQTIWTWHRRLAGGGTWYRVLERPLTAAPTPPE
ncbi:hypothetical protein R4282_07225 [Rhodococcus oxybenzonivorans]|uniref:hypothetical protein n=1 Tax=Rhodococcus oxybenzonivorans TaxID=1990687 RepID=UPI002954C1CF|nr:hypothetical protein [Rhodococcus oxybenzonivorans]MDV7352803.1 hypothetical protein [Rhodococcus oxybenzonivorans]